VTRSFVHDEHFFRWLLSKGASPDTKGEFDVTPTSVAIYNAPMSTVRLLLNHSSGVQYGQLLHFAVQRKCDDTLEAVELLLHLGCPIDSIYFKDDERSWLEWGRREAGTALFAAAQQGMLDVVAFLLSSGANITKTSNRGRTARDVAESKRHFEIVQLLDEWV
jgi:ankyrin repeat protein